MRQEGVRPLLGRDNMMPFMLTTTIRRLATGPYYITIPKAWGLDAKTTISASITNRETGFTFKFTRCLCERGTSVAVYVPKRMADMYLKEDTLVNMTLEIAEEGCDAKTEREQDQGRHT